MSKIHILINLILVISVISIYTTMHPIYSILLLVIIVCQIAFILFIFNIEFLNLLIIIVYGGAIAVLFLFVIMMLNIKVTPQMYLNKFLWLSTISIIIIILFFYMLISNLFSFNFIKLFFYSNFNFKTNNIDVFNNLDMLGQFIFTNYIHCLLLIGLGLLVPLIGSVVLTFNYDNIKKKNFSNFQLSRSFNTTSFFK